MQIQLHNVSPEQLEGLKKNFDANEMVISNGEEQGKYDVSIQMKSELEAWKLFFSGADYTLAKMGRVKV